MVVGTSKTMSRAPAAHVIKRYVGTRPTELEMSAMLSKP